MKILKLTLTSLALTLATSAHGVIISHGGYTHDTNTNIVTGNGLEWLQWDETVGESMNSIQSQLNTLEGGGWSVASNEQMAHLFNAFDFGITFDSDENTSQTVDTGFSTGDSGPETDLLFIDMFGDTLAHTGPNCNDGDCRAMSRAYFGLNPDQDTRINWARVDDDWITPTGMETPGIVALYADGRTFDDNLPSFGVALVRDVSAVPVPAAVWLFGSGLIGLVGVARRKARP